MKGFALVIFGCFIGDTLTGTIVDSPFTYLIFLFQLALLIILLKIIKMNWLIFYNRFKNETGEEIYLHKFVKLLESNNVTVNKLLIYKKYSF